jgi:imidazoleglycerol phosphate dehydratase HisB
MPRHAHIHRKTNETEVTVSLDLDGQGCVHSGYWAFVTS